MPYTNMPRSMWPKMDRCVKSVMAQGHDKQGAIAICYASMMGKDISDKAEKEMQEWMAEWAQYAVKVK